MRKIIVLLAIVALGLGVTGATCLETVCNPTADQQATAAEYKAQAVTLLDFLQFQVQDEDVKASIAGVQAAISVYEQVLAGVCMAIDVVQGADKAVTANQKFARAKLAYRR